ncbi:response regulator [Pseudanabaena sp. FACHB-2040]|uniref:response regulator n=1 Tax=Pseudanabaena sp. FACHB-2040 TaxID=2692859 RepID=UPI00168854FB|nr:response regulator [Pseudanabaena sp. FACHB-2040]MBD2257119.1 response regulator [Pseudanabaena sp. FACHB-2040]
MTMTSAILTAPDESPRSRKPSRPRMLVVDDEPDNLDLLYRTFRRDFQILRAASGKEALAVLAEEGEVAVIISDQRMPEMKGTEFLSRTVPQFPDTMRIILTGFTDVEDLVDAINAGQVYRYITKPWDPEELRQVVRRAVDTYEALKQRTDELYRAHIQTVLLSSITQIAQTVDHPEAALPSIASVFAETFQADGCVIQLVADGQPVGVPGTAGSLVDAAAFSSSPLVAAAIAQRQVQRINEAAAVAAIEGPSPSDMCSLLLTPTLYRNQVVAVMALRWRVPRRFSESQQEGLALATGHLALALMCLQG